MNLYIKASEFAAIFIVLLFAALVLRRLNVLNRTDAPVFARLIVNLVLPALLLSHLARVKADASVIADALLFFLVEVIAFCLALFFGRYVLKLPKFSLGVFVLCSTIGSTAILGVSYVSYVFDGNLEAVARALLVSQLAVGVPAYIVCPIVMIWSSPSSIAQSTALGKCVEVFKTPTIIAVFLGIFWSAFKLPTQGIFMEPFFGAMDIASQSLVFLVAILLGLTIERSSVIRKSLPVVLSCALLVLVVEPLMLYVLQKAMGIPEFNLQICYLLSSMPAAYTIIAYAVRYEADVKLASTLVIATKLISVVTIPSLMLLLPLLSR
jgi:predicted permease